VVKNKHHLTVDGRQVSLSNLDKVLYPGTRFTKGQVMDYHIRGRITFCRICAIVQSL